MKSLRKLPGKLLSFFKKQSLKKKILIITILIILGMVIWGSISNGNGTNYNVERVQRADITETVDESGLVKISGQTDIYSPTNGIIEEIYVTNGQYVEKDQELFKVQSTATEQEQQSAYATYLSAVTTLNAAQSNLDVLQADMFAKWDTFKELAESDEYEDGDGNPRHDRRAVPEFHIPEKQWLAAEQKYKDQQQVIGQAQVAVNAAWLQYQATQTTVVKSTAAGTVANLSVVLHDTVQASSGGTPVSLASVGTAIKPILTIADYTVIGVLLSIGESDINKVEAGDTATIDVDPIDNKTYAGIVTRVDEIGTDNAGLIQYDVFVEIKNRDDQLKAGMTADAEIITEKLTNVLSVPNTAVKPYEGGRAVQIVNDKNELEFIPVVVGVRGEERTEIVKGLTEGQEIVVSLTNDQVERQGLFGN